MFAIIKVYRILTPANQACKSSQFARYPVPDPTQQNGYLQENLSRAAATPAPGSSHPE
jgi:hypothetical protein